MLYEILRMHVEKFYFSAGFCFLLSMSLFLRSMGEILDVFLLIAFRLLFLDFITRILKLTHCTGNRYDLNRA